ncbi:MULTISPECIES: class I SAM-dependent methyltransferase [Empedobacter]|uniref:class I SAM-dependent methyltransferase n=1 Tax=Empedobacter TaxID=59734 RepID=UPI00244AA101|nr:MULTISPECIES: class I SAM-dependent methyltransferase [Empedobacter]MDH1882949.1 class I SAM-dependent methyltransferase [Empedobacter sp. GD03797]MDM1040776.1 methyltransferase domain-containing protein [Empedobacter brevis]MDM1134357.1 methyltransferase domain-containing protein [Empedobacter sp. R750]
MTPETNYIEINKQSWNNRTEAHLKSDFYNLEEFIKGATSLNSIELDLLGDIKGKSILHLQCHFGQDTISLNRLGANVIGIDLSDKAIESARKIAIDTNSTAEFICCDLYDIENHLNKQFDIIFTSYGTITWLPDLDQWGKLISKFLKPNGKFVFAEFHPVVWMFDDNFDKIGYNYFNVESIIETENGTYADRNADISQSYVTWNHSMSEVITSLIDNGMELKQFQEYDYSPYNCFNKTFEFEPKKYRIKHLENKIPMVYSIVAKKKN